MKIYQYLISIAFTPATIMGIVTSANALPGQNINNVIQWSEAHSFLPKLTPVKRLEDGYPNYSSDRNLNGGSLSFNVYTHSRNIVTSETIDYRTYQGGNQNLEFAKNNSSGLRLVRQIYGSSITKDFQDSKYITQLPLDGYLRFYKGRKFAYQVWTAKSSHQFTVIPVSNLQETINKWLLKINYIFFSKIH
jgi:hypothetical protein